MAKNLAVTGVGGWLAWLIFGLLVLGPLSMVGRTYSDLSAAEHLSGIDGNPQWQLFKQITWTVVACSAALSIATGYRLWRDQTSSSLSLAKWSLWLIGPVTYALHSLVIPAVVLNAPVEVNEFARFVGGLVASCIGATVWTLYLSRSVRVLNTYRRRFVPVY
jgi:hypothetical protein